MTRIMTRTFFPVGNGIFCLERFENRHAVVYDCGSTSKKRIEHRVSELADRNDIDVIDYVFISHLHEDHVNGLPTLLEIFDVRRVVMPFMSEGDRDLLLLWRKLPQLQSNATPALDSYDFVDKLIIDPAETVEGYSEGTEVSFVAPLDEGAEGEMAPTENANSRPFHVSGMPRAQKVSQSSIIKGEISLETDSSSECWQYVPFTIRYAEKTRELKRSLEELGIKPSTDVIDHIREHGCQDIKGIYRKITNGQFNLYSMAVYSCSPRTNLHLRVEACAPSCRERLINRELNVPCLYLGDYEASNDKNWELLMNHLEDTAGYPPLEGLGCLQAPHHGSHRNFRDEFVSGGFLSVIPAKLNQAHPSAKVLMKYIENNVDPYVVTDVDETLLELRVDS